MTELVHVESERKETCEWCEALAVWKLVAKEYERFACDKHHTKTRNLVFLDGHDEWTTVGNTQGFGEINAS